MRKFKQLIIFVCVLVFSLSACTSTNSDVLSGIVDYNTFCFYYNWYGNPEHDGEYVHWAHPVLKQGANDTITKGYLSGDDDISTNFWPKLGTYSSNDRKIVSEHMQMMKRARIGVLVLTWWGREHFAAKSIPLILDEAAKYDLKVCFHIEPFGDRNASSTFEQIKYIFDSYGGHKAFYKKDEKPLYFIYDSYLTPSEEWATLLKPDGKITMRGTNYDADMIGLWVKEGEENSILEAGFDGFYTYFGATGFTYGSTPDNWTYMQNFANENNIIFIPCVGPGYIDTRVRPWNTATTRDREEGKYYDRMYKGAIDCGASYIGITSFNEWHEGTQIEPAVSFNSDAFDYIDYTPLDPDYYLRRTAYWVEEFQKKNK